MTDLGQINPDVITDLHAISDDAGLGDAGVARNHRPGECEGILVVNPAVSFLRQHAFVVYPATSGSGFDVVKVGKGNDLAQQDAFLVAVILITKGARFFTQVIFAHGEFPFARLR